MNPAKKPVNNDTHIKITLVCLSFCCEKDMFNEHVQLIKIEKIKASKRLTNII